MKYKIVVNRIFRTEHEIEVESHDAAMQYAEDLQNAELPADAVRSDDVGIQLISEE